MVKLVKIQSNTPAEKKATLAKTAKSGKAAKMKEAEDENEDKLEDETPLAPQGGKASFSEGKPAPLKETAPVKAEESKEEDDDTVNEVKSEPPSKETSEMTAPTEELAEANDEEAEEMDAAPVPVSNAKDGGMVKLEEDLEDEEIDDDDADDDDDDDDGEEEEEMESSEDEDESEPALTPGKRKAKAKSEADAPPVKKPKSEDKGFCLFVGNLDKSKSFSEIKGALATFFKENDLEIQNVRLGSSKKFGYVNFATEEQLQKALTLNGQKVMDLKLRLDKAKTKTRETPQEVKKAAGQTKTLFIKGLPKETTEETLRETFEGAVAARVATNKGNGSSKGFGFVDFDSEESCKMAKESMKYCEIDGNKVTLDFALLKGERGQHHAKRGRGGRGRFGRGGGFRGGRGGKTNRGSFKGRAGGLKGKPQEKKEV